MMRFCISASLMASILWAAVPAVAQIVIGQTAGFTGAVSDSVKEASDGARLYIDFVNERGGVAGQKIELLQIDDQFEPKKAAENARVLIEEKGVMALFLSRGTPQTEAILPVLEKNQTVLVAPSTGAMSLHLPVQKYVFNVRTSYQREAERAVQHLKSMNVQRLGVIYRDDSFGSDGFIGVTKGMATYGLKAIVVEKYDRKLPDFSKAIEALVKENVQSIVFIGGGNEVVAGIKALRAAGSTAQVISLSNNASSGFAKALGEQAAGVVVLQVFPPERSPRYLIARELMDLSAKAKLKDVSPAMMEGFAAAKVLVEAIKRASPKPTREKIRLALQAMNDYDLGGLSVSFSPQDHTGLNFVDISIISSDGKFRR